MPTEAPRPEPVSPQPAALNRQISRLAALPQPAWLHEEVGRRLADKLDAIRLTPKDWVDWGAFLGTGADLVAQRYPQARRWVLEPNEALAERSRQVWTAGHARPWWQAWKKSTPPVVSQGQPWPDAWPTDGAGLLWANMALHAQADLDGALKAWHGALAINGFVMCSGLGPDTARELRAVYRELGWPLPTIHFIDMHDLGDAMVKAGFLDPVMDMERLTLTWADATSMLAELRTWGGNVAWGRFAGLRTPRWRERLIEVLNQHLRGPDGRLRLTVEVVYGHAIKPLPKVPLAEETRVSLGDMKRLIKAGGKPG